MPPLVSATVAVHVAVWLSNTSVELQVIVVDVVLSTTVRPNVLELPVWSESPPYTAEMSIEPSFPRVGVYVMEQLPPVRLQVELKVPDPAGESLKVTVPVAVNVVPGLESLTVAVHVAGAPTESGNGVQLREVVLVRIVEVTVAVFELPEWAASPV